MRTHQQMRNRLATILLTATSLGVTGCSSFMDIPQIKAPNFANMEWNPYTKVTAATTTEKRRVVTAADYVNADGACDTTGAEAASAQEGSRGVALQMTECNLVQVLGAPEKVEIGADASGERTARLLYTRGDRPGLYHFTAGQLKSIDRVAEPAPARPQKPQTKPRRAAT